MIQTKIFYEVFKNQPELRNILDSLIKKGSTAEYTNRSIISDSKLSGDSMTEISHRCLRVGRMAAFSNFMNSA